MRQIDVEETSPIARSLPPLPLRWQFDFETLALVLIPFQPIGLSRGGVLARNVHASPKVGSQELRSLSLSATSDIIDSLMYHRIVRARSFIGFVRVNGRLRALEDAWRGC